MAFNALIAYQSLWSFDGLPITQNQSLILVQYAQTHSVSGVFPITTHVSILLLPLVKLAEVLPPTVVYPEVHIQVQLYVVPLAHISALWSFASEING